MITVRPDGYYSKNGRIAPRVTRVLRRLFETGHPNASFYMERGRLVHEATHLIDGGRDGSGLDWDSLDPELRPFVKAYSDFVSCYQFETERAEYKVFSERFLFGGTIDRIGVFKSPLIDRRISPHAVLDIFCGLKKKHPGKRLQTAAYHKAYQEQHPSDTRIFHRWGLGLHSDGTYHLERYTYEYDFNRFLNYLGVWNYEVESGIVQPAYGEPDSFEHADNWL